MPKYTPEQYARRNDRLLAHTSLHKVLLPLVAAIIFGDGKALGHPLKELSKRGWLSGFLRSIPGGYSYYTLGPKGAERLGLSRDKASPLSGIALALSIALAFFCVLGRHRRYKLTADETTKLFGAQVVTNVSFVVTDELEGETKVLRVVYGTSADATDIVRQLRVLIDQASGHPTIEPWLRAKQYGFAVLGVTSEAVTALERAIDRSGLRTHSPIIVDLGPDPDNYAAAVKRWEGR